jgi:predicted nucleic acid-binding protein
MSAMLFVDTNVLLYQIDRADPRKHKIARRWREWLWASRRGRLSFQVLQEFYSNVCRKWPEAKKSARSEISDLLNWRPVVVDADVLLAAWALQDRYGFSFWDSLVVSAAKASLCGFLLSEDFQTGQDLDGLLIINPFETKPEEI